MRKNDLIAILQDIRGNPEIMLWNGFTQDVVPINPRITENTLYKEDATFLAQFLKQWHLTDDQIITRLKNRKWEYKEGLPPDNTACYIEKRVCILQPKITGKMYSDRTGTMEY
jgi:hypothetical protein